MTRDVYGDQDTCLIAIVDGRPVDSDRLRSLPPWRAHMIARVAELAGATFTHGDSAARIHTDASRVGGEGELPPIAPGDLGRAWAESQPSRVLGEPGGADAMTDLLAELQASIDRARAARPRTVADLARDRAEPAPRPEDT